MAFIFIMDSQATLNHLQYVNTENANGMDQTLGTMNFGHISAIFGQPKNWDDRSHVYDEGHRLLIEFGQRKILQGLNST